ncbi:MAG: tyrosine-type recombinase/integrase [Bacteriovoracaceae bacterium]|nr:tyrosine-type recombinase/integrase [Bacteriovoracaceae bacterium]
MSLTNIKVKSAKPGIKPDGTPTDKRYKLTDGKGLYLEVAPKGGKWWRFKYRFAGKEKRLSLGVYPEISLKEARDRRDELRKQVANGLDPSYVRKAEKVSEAGLESFEHVAREWHSKFRSNWTEGHAARTLTRIEKDVFPWLGKRNITEITAPELLQVLNRVEKRGAFETAHRINQICGQIFRYAIATSRAERDLSTDLKGALTPTRVKHHASITDLNQVGELLRAIDSYTGSSITALALRLSPLLFVRPGELRQAEWLEIDLIGKEWRIPAEKMKMRELHIVPLSKQAISLLNELQPLTGKSKYLFPSIRTITRPMSNNTINASLRRLGYTKEQMTAHGFRSMASTILNEKGWNRDVIERQLAHAERDSVRAAYNYADYIEERKKMMQYWADLLDELKLDIKH